jgi:uncharacterized membrane protein
VAVLFMIQCHTIMFLLDPALKGSPVYGTLLKLDGLVAPSFIFSAGFSLALVQVRSASAPGGRARRALKTLRRLSEVLAVATLVNWCWFPVFREPKWLLRIDILHCIGLSLLIALPLMTWLAPRPRVLRWVTLALAVLCFWATPYFKDTTRWPSLFLNQSSGAQFPLLPWAGYVYLGASAGATAAAGELRALVAWIVLLLLLGLGAWQGLGLDHPQRVFWVMSFVLVFLFLEHRVPRLTATPPFAVVTALGTSSLAGYFLHELMLFYGAWWAFAGAILIAWRLPTRPALAALALAPVVAYQSIGRVRGFAMADFFRDRASWPEYWALLALMLAATYLLVLVVDALYKRLDREPWLARKRPEGVTETG